MVFILQFSDNRKANLNLEPKLAVVPERYAITTKKNGTTLNLWVNTQSKIHRRYVRPYKNRKNVPLPFINVGILIRCSRDGKSCVRNKSGMFIKRI
jgi:hypothetical protein